MTVLHTNLSKPPVCAINPILQPQTLIWSLIYTDLNTEVKYCIVTVTVIPTELRDQYRTRGSMLNFFRVTAKYVLRKQKIVHSNICPLVLV